MFKFTSSVILAIFQGYNHQVWLVTTMFDGTDTEHFVSGEGSFVPC